MYSTMASTLLPGVKKYLIAYCVLAVILFILTIVNLALQDWYDYCLWEMGLVSAKALESEYKVISDSSTIKGVRDDVCKGGELEDAMDYLCPGFCGNFAHFRDGGGVMVFFGVLTLVAILASGGMHVLAIIGRPWKNRLFWAWVNAPFFVWLLGLIIYGAVTNISHIDDTRGSAKNVKLEGGVGMCIFMAIALLAMNGFAMVFTRKAFIE